MSNTQIPQEMQRQIEHEAYILTSRFKTNNDYQTGYSQGVNDGYEQGATHYAALLVEEREKAKELLNSLSTLYTMFLKPSLSVSKPRIPEVENLILRTTQALKEADKTEKE